MPTATYTISDLAREFDLTPRAMRFYEDMGLLQPERAGPGGRVTCTAKKIGWLFLVC